MNANEWDIQADTAKAVSRDGIIEAQVDASGPQGPVLSLHEVIEGMVVGIPLEVARALIQAYDRRAAPARSSGGAPVVIPREWTITTQTPADNGWPRSASRAVATSKYGLVVWVAHQHDPPELVFESLEDDIDLSAPLAVVEQVLAHHHLAQATAAVAKEHSATAALAEPLFPGLLYPDPNSTP